MKLVIFDLDGVLTETSSLHEYCFIEAVKAVFGIEISSEQYNKYGTLPSAERLLHLALDGVIPRFLDLMDSCHNYKQNLTRQLVRKVKIDDDLINELRQISRKKVICVASNAQSWFVEEVLRHNGVYEYFYLVYGADKVKTSKPAPDIFNRIMQDTGNLPEETMIFEDSPTGIEAAEASGATVIRIESVSDTAELIRQYVI